MFIEQLMAEIITEFNLRHENYAGELTALHNGADLVLQFHGITATIPLPDGSTFYELPEVGAIWLMVTNAFSELIEIYEREERED